MWPLSFSFLYQIPVCIYFYPIYATCPAHFILLYLITRTTFDEQYRSLSSSLCSCLHSPVTSPPLNPNTPLSTLLSILKHPQPKFLSQCYRPSFAPVQNNMEHQSSEHIKHTQHSLPYSSYTPGKTM